MANWILSDSETSKPQPQSQENGLLSGIKRVATATGIKALEGGESLANIVNTLYGNKLSQKEIDYLDEIANQYGPKNALAKEIQQPKAPEPLSSTLKEQYNLTPEYLEPQNAVENFIQRVGKSAIPSVALGGVPALTNLAYGSGAAALSGALGAPEILQDLIQGGTEIGRGVYTGKLPSIKQAQKTAYEAIPKAAETNIRNIQNVLGEVESKLGTEVNKSLVTKIKDTLGTVYSNIKSDKTISPNDAVALRRSINKFGKELSPDDAALYIKPLKDGFEEFFTMYSAENPKFYDALKAADKLTELKKMNLFLPKIIKFDVLKKYSEVIPDILNAMVKEPERFARSIFKNSAARKYYFDLFKAQDNPVLQSQYINKIYDLMPDFFGKSKIENNDWIISES